MSEPKSRVQAAPQEAIWVRGDTGLCNLAYVRSFAIHQTKEDGPWFVWAHAALRDSKAIPLRKCASEAEARAALDEISTLVDALDITQTKGDAS